MTRRWETQSSEVDALGTRFWPMFFRRHAAILTSAAKEIHALADRLTDLWPIPLADLVAAWDGALMIQENAAREVRPDLEAFFERTAPEDPALCAHHDEGPDDMPAHIRVALTQTHILLPVIDAAPALGTGRVVGEGR